VDVDAHHHLWQRARGYAWLDDPELAAIRRDFDVDDLRSALRDTGVRRTVLVEGGRCDAAEVGEFLGIADALFSAEASQSRLAADALFSAEASQNRLAADALFSAEASQSRLAADALFSAEASQNRLPAEATVAIAGVVGWADLTDPALADTLAAHRAAPGGRRLVGIRAQVQGEADPGYLKRPDVLQGLSTVAAAGLAYDLLVRVDQLPAAAQAAQAVPQLTFVLDHLGKPRIRDGAAGLAEWRAAITPLAAEPNVVAKLSGMVTEADWREWTVDDLRPFVQTALELFGPQRLMFGSDWPVCLLAASYAKVRQALDGALGDALSPAERAAIYGDTAVRSYHLEV
jgi:L-fuconolactonase